MTNKESLQTQYNSIIDEDTTVQIDMIIHFSKWGDNTIKNITTEQLESIYERYNDNLELKDCTEIYIKEVTMHTDSITHSIIFNRRDTSNQLKEDN